MKKPNAPFLTALSVLACAILLPEAQAVVPAPDGAYPNGNTAEGHNALFSLATGGYNAAIGWLSLESNMTGSANTGVGAGTLALNTADGNTAIGAGALLSNTSGLDNTADGAFALFSNTAGGANAANGFAALFGNTSGSSNTANGYQALVSNTTGMANTAVGGSALQASMTGDNNIAIGFNAGVAVTTASDVICIGVNGANVDNSCFIGHIRGVTTGTGNAVPVLIDSLGQLGTVSSSRRYKTDIKPMDKSSESILALNPVSFRYKVHKDTTPQFGLIAEDVAAIDPNLVIYEADGKPYTVRYEAVNVMLLNEFLKEHRRVEQQQATIAQLYNGMNLLKAQVKKQAAQIHRVSAQVEMRKLSPELAVNER